MNLDMASLFAARERERYALHARYLNDQLVRVAKTIGYDIGFVSGQGQYLFDRAGTRYLDLVGGWGAFALGRNHPVVRDALLSVLGADLPNLVQMDVSPLAGILAERLLRHVPWLDKAFFASSGAESAEAALKFARNATGRPGFVYCGNGFHGLTLGALSVNGDAAFRKGFGTLLADSATPPSSSSRSRARACTCPTAGTCGAPRSCAASSARCSSRTRSRPGSAAPARSSRSSTTRPSPIWCCSRRACPAGTSRSAPC
jgi:ornithine--oxo-acid transaminase